MMLVLHISEKLNFWPIKLNNTFEWVHYPDAFVNCDTEVKVQHPLSLSLSLCVCVCVCACVRACVTNYYFYLNSNSKS